MASPNTSVSTSTFILSGNLTLDPLLDETHEKWGGVLGQGANLSFSFPWINGNPAYFQSDYSTKNEQLATVHFGFNETQIVAARNALEAWTNVAQLTFDEVPDTSSNVGDFRFAFTSAISSDAWGWDRYPNNYWASAADIWVNSTHGNDAAWSPGTYNYEALMHEIGHGLGLKHPGNYGDTPGPYLPPSLDIRNYTIMSYNDPDNDQYWDSSKSKSVPVAPETPMVYDIQAIQYLYGANTNYHTGNDTYTFSPSNPFYETIWDAGGNDTIDISAFSLGSTINVNPGSYSTIAFPAPNSSWFNGTNDLGIAFHVVIENVIGGSGDDTLIGNSANNSLDGGAGTDMAVFYSERNNFSFIKNSNYTYTVNDTTGAAGMDTLTNIERLSFSDGVYVALDIASSNQVAGAALALLYAGFDSLPDATIFGHWIAKANQINSSLIPDNSKVESLAQAMLTAYAPDGISNSSLVNILYTNVVGHIPDSKNLYYYTQLLDNDAYSQAGLLTLAAESSLNTEQYATLIGGGLQYIPEHGELS